MGGAEHGADDLRRFAGVNEVVDYQPGIVDPCEVGSLEDVGRRLVAHCVARYADGVHQANVELARDDRRGDQPSARHGYETAPVGADVKQLPGEGAAVPLYLFPRYGIIFVISCGGSGHLYSPFHEFG